MTAAERARGIAATLGRRGIHDGHMGQGDIAEVVETALLAHEAEVLEAQDAHDLGPQCCQKCSRSHHKICARLVEAEVREECIRLVCDHCRLGVPFVEYEDGEKIDAHIWNQGTEFESRGGCYGQAIRDSGREKGR